jgi:TPR repeat protein
MRIRFLPSFSIWSSTMKSRLWCLAGVKASLPLAGLVFTLLLGLPIVAGSEQELRKMAEAGDATAQNDLGVRYYEGDGVPKDLTEAVKWFQKAA